MANWCRNTILAVGAEAEISRFVNFVVTEPEVEETTFTGMFETGLMYRDVGAARIEVISKWNPPLDEIVELSRDFPTLKLSLEWEEPGEQLCGCASISNGNIELVRLDGDVFGEISDEDGRMMLRFETMRETSRLLFGPDWREEGGPWGDNSRRCREAAQQIANAAFTGRPKTCRHDKDEGSSQSKSEGF